ncbi:MAG TPA: hypothetical protein OIM48_01930 [Clostridiaceae bacterium]|nr:hypothetical protein [Clostridiaceae bacterium]
MQIWEHGEIISKTFTGKLEGNSHKISNIRMGNDGGLFKDLRGKINNLNVENYTNEKAKNYRVGLVEYLKGGTINNVHVNKATIKIDLAYKGAINCAGLVAYAETGTIKNSSINNLNIETNAEVTSTAIGGIIANSKGSSISNCFTQDINFKINKTINSLGIGGICGYDSTSNNITNCYSTGNIEADTSNIGGILGFAQNGEVQSCYSTINIITDGEYIGGIVGNDRQTILNNNINNLAIGNVYSRQVTNTVNRAVGNSQEEENNYAYKMQRFNGKISNEKAGAILASAQELKDKDFYERKIGLGNGYDYENVKDGELPKLLYSNRKELLPNQTENKLKEDMELEIEEVEADKTSSNIVKLRAVIKNSKEVKITKLYIEDMDAKIDTDITKEGKTYLNITATPTRYYDSYRISKIKYIEDNKEKEKQVEAKIETQFYKEIYTYEDWAEIGTDTYENYKLMADINFENKENIKTNLTIGKLEGNGHKIKNLKIVLKESNSGLIKLIKTTLNNTNFENINIVNSASGERTGVIANSNGKIEKITINNITVNAPKMNKVGFIGNSTSEEIKNINMDTIEIIGNGNVAGLAGGSELPILREVDAKNLNIVGSGNYVGGVLSNPTKRIGYNIKNVTVSNSHIQGVDYVGGVLSHLSGGGNNGTQGENLKSIKNEVIGRSYVGGVAGQFYDANSFTSENVTVRGSGSNIGGVCGNGGLNYAVCKNSAIEGTTSNSNNIGGVMGQCTWDNGYDYGINNIVISKGSSVGGLYGYYNVAGTGGAISTYVKGGRVEGYSKVGGVIGYNYKGYVAKTYTDTNVTGISEVGGIVGYVLNQSIEASSMGIKNCYVANSTIKAQNNVGGLVGSFSNSVGEGIQYFYNNYVHADIISDNKETASLGFGKQKNEIVGAKNIYVYKYSTVNGERVSTENDKYIVPANYLAEVDLKQESTYKTKIGWEANYIYTTLKEGKYPIISGVSNQEGVILPTDPLENITNEDESQSLEEDIISGANNEDVYKEKLQYTFNYKGKIIKTYETYSEIIAEDNSKTVRNDMRLYVKDGNLYALPVTMDIDGNKIKLVENNFIIDSFNGKEYETVLGSDGKIYDLKEAIKYPENFVNNGIASMGNNLTSEDFGKKLYEIEVTYKNGNKVRFNYQTGEIISLTEKLNKTELFDYVKDKLLEIGKSNSGELQEITTKYEESKKLQNKLEKIPVEEALQRKNSNTNKLDDIANSENNEANNSLKETRYISIYNTEKDEYQIYQEEELLDTTKQEVVSENEKIEANNLNKYYASEGKSRNKNMGILWITLSIIGVVIILFAIKKRN